MGSEQELKYVIIASEAAASQEPSSPHWPMALSNGEDVRRRGMEKVVVRTKIHLDVGGCRPREPNIGPGQVHSSPGRPTVGPGSKSYIFWKKSVFGPGKVIPIWILDPNLVRVGGQTSPPIIGGPG